MTDTAQTRATGSQSLFEQGVKDQRPGRRQRPLLESPLILYLQHQRYPVIALTMGEHDPRTSEDTEGIPTTIFAFT
jgi:hypothetical protein